jgi:predicted PurR-regulated permease PerM
VSDDVDTVPVTVRHKVPWRTIWASIGAVLLTFVLLLLVRELARIILWLVMAGFLAAVLTPPVDWLHRRFGMRRGLAVGTVVLVFFLIFAAMMTAFIVPLVRQATNFADDLPGYVEDAQAGRGTIGELIERYDLQDLIDQNQERLQNFLSDLGGRSFGVLRAISATVLAVFTIFVLTIFIVSAGPRLTRRAITLVPAGHRDRARAVGSDSAKAASGYVFGNLLISVVAGLSTWLVLSILGVPYAGVLALWVAFADLIPLFGATLGAIPTIGFAFLHSTTAGIVALAFYIAYQQFENHVLQPQIMARTVDVSPLTVLVAVLCGIELAGFAGAVLAIPAASVIQVIIRDIWDFDRGSLKVLPTIGVDQEPVRPTRPGVKDLLGRIRRREAQGHGSAVVPVEPVPPPDAVDT